MMCSYEKSRDAGVSPVVGVMLMLVVVIIIAAVISGFAGNLTKSQDKAPTAAIDVTIKNSGEWKGSYIQFEVKSVSEPISTSNLKIVTSWVNSAGTSGGNATMKGLNSPNTKLGSTYYQAPLGYGPGVAVWNTSSSTTVYPNGGYAVEQQFGNYTITAGTTMRASPQGYTTYGYGVTNPYEYTTGSGWATGYTDSIMAVLGTNWSTLRTGDTVKVSIVHIPSGKTILSKNVQVV